MSAPNLPKFDKFGSYFEGTRLVDNLSGLCQCHFVQPLISLIKSNSLAVNTKLDLGTDIEDFFV